MSHECCNDFTRAQLLRGGGRRSGPRPARDRAGDADPSRHRPHPAQVPLPQRRRRARRLRRLEDPALGLRPRHRRGGDAGQGPDLDLLRRRDRRDERARPGRRPALRETPTQHRPGARSRRTLHRGHPPAVAPGRRAAGRTPCRGQGRRLPGDRLRTPRPVALHLAPLLRDRGARHRPARGLARSLPRRRRRRRKPAAGALDGRLALAHDGDRAKAGGGDRQRRRLRNVVAGQRPDRRRDVQELRQASARCRATRRRSSRSAGRPPRPRRCARN